MVQLTLLSLPAPVLSIATRYCKLVVDEKKNPLSQQYCFTVVLKYVVFVLSA